MVHLDDISDLKRGVKTMNNLTLLLKAFITCFNYITVYGLITIPFLVLIMLVLNAVKTRYKPN